MEMGTNGFASESRKHTNVSTNQFRQMRIVHQYRLVDYIANDPIGNRHCNKMTPLEIGRVIYDIILVELP